MVCPEPLHDLPALFRFRLPARLRSMDLRRRHQLGDNGALVGHARNGCHVSFATSLGQRPEFKGRTGGHCFSGMLGNRRCKL